MKTFNATVAMTVFFSIVSPLISAQVVKAQEQDYYTVAGEAVTLTAAVEASGNAVPPAGPSSDRRSLNKGGGGGLVNAGVTAWNVVNSGAPSGSYASAYASAIPGFMFNWGNMAGWKGPKEMVYRYKVTNLMGIDVIDVKYKISFFYGGTEDYSGEAASQSNPLTQRSGSATDTAAQVHGSYITNFTVQPVSVNVKWGWHFDLAVKMSDPMNVGTKLNPVSALRASLNWIRSTPFSTNGGTLTYGVDGLGNFKDLNPVQKEMTESIPVQIDYKDNTPGVSWN